MQHGCVHWHADDLILDGDSNTLTTNGYLHCLVGNWHIQFDIIPDVGDETPTATYERPALGPGDCPLGNLSKVISTCDGYGGNDTWPAEMTVYS